MFSNAWGIIDRSKRGISIAVESIKFGIRNIDIVFIYLIGSILSTLFAVSIAVVPWFFGVLTRSGVFFVASILASAGMYAFTMFFWHGIAVHLVGSRMLGDELGIRTAVRDVLDRPSILAKWALITAVVKMLAVLSNSDDTSNKSVFRFIPKVSVLSIYRTATFFIHPTLVFYSSNDTREEISQALYVYASRIVEVLAMKAAMTIFTVILVTGGVALIISSVILVPFLALTVEMPSIAIVSLFAATPILAVGAIIFLAGITWSLDKLLFDIGKTAVYLDSEAPVENLEGFNQTVIHPSEDLDREAIFRSNAPEAVINRLQTWSGSGEFRHRL